MNFDYALIKQGLGLPEDAKIKVKPSSGGYTISYVQKSIGISKEVKRNSILFWYSVPYNLKKSFPCKHCGQHLDFDQINFHHIIFKSAGGRDEFDNLLPICFHCHVGDRAIHANKWHISEVVGHVHLENLRERYGIKN